MLLTPFTLHKVQKYFSGLGLRREEDIRWRSLEACDPPELDPKLHGCLKDTALKLLRGSLQPSS
jgi:hypothetical protein